MTGWKTWLGAGVSIAYGVGGYLLGLHDHDAAVAFVVSGIGMTGIGHKIEKLGKGGS